MRFKGDGPNPEKRRIEEDPAIFGYENETRRIALERHQGDRVQWPKFRQGALFRFGMPKINIRRSSAAAMPLKAWATTPISSSVDSFSALGGRQQDHCWLD
ncbi:MAG: hypothetical protein IPJ38_13480 [Dechloromonas sp.]|uniref:Uncharacterized protein n=1 Tax=Candidatus Dechloromonas phosphorivorans TaxID=2899244 RepID=A0A935MZ62_9RHOO|nr:hypothetical protein [Candidatus Dechloromonas phosphorivorans]